MIAQNTLSIAAIVTAVTHQTVISATTTAAIAVQRKIVTTAVITVRTVAAITVKMIAAITVDKRLTS